MVFDEPELKRYTSANGTTHLSGSVFPSGTAGETHLITIWLAISLSAQLLALLEQLCYTIVYYKVMHQALGKSGPSQ